MARQAREIFVDILRRLTQYITASQDRLFVSKLINLETDNLSPIFCNGCTISVNWGETAVEDLPPMSYRVERG